MVSFSISCTDWFPSTYNGDKMSFGGRGIGFHVVLEQKVFNGKV